ncbi:hypothetical protein AALB53_20425 [Lachnospiraceae bacterium 47-T17]
MTITSFSFLALILIGMIFYYIIPKSMQWLELLIISLIFYYFAATPYTIAYLIFSTIVAYISTLKIEQYRKEKSRNQVVPLVVAIMAIVINLAIWFVFKGNDFWFFWLESLISHGYISQINIFLNIELIPALGMGYYTLQVIGYIIDCYWENVQPQKNPLKLFLFTAYFPQLTTGPISRYSNLTILFDKHKFVYQNIAFGAQRILWGFMKKMVLAERVGVLVSAINASPESYNGFYSWLVILLYPIQMYADFSGCMDIVLGVSELFDIHLAENFKNPFFARTSQEFWQRWHITLGTWAKDYVLYPLLKSKPMIHLGKNIKKKFDRKVSKFLVNAIGMFVLWMVMGIWHGGMKYIVGVSLWYWFILMLGELFIPVFLKVASLLNMKTESFAWHLFQSSRTYLIYAIGATFFSVGVSEGLSLLQDAWKVLTVKNYANPWIFFDGSILDLGITYGDINIFVISILMLLVVAVLREKYGYARIWIQKQSFIFRWLIWIGLFIMVLIWGKYGPGYNASEFIYQGF